MLAQLVAAADGGAGEDAADEARHGALPRDGGGEVQDPPESDEVGRVRVVLDVADGAAGDG